MRLDRDATSDRSKHSAFFDRCRFHYGEGYCIGFALPGATLCGVHDVAERLDDLRAKERAQAARRRAQEAANG